MCITWNDAQLFLPWLNRIDPGKAFAFPPEPACRGGSTRDRYGELPAITFEPLPLELAREEEPLARLLGSALEAAGIHPASTGDPLLSRVLETETVALLVAVNETGQPLRRTFAIAGRHHILDVLPGRSRCQLIEKATGRVLANLGRPGPLSTPVQPDPAR